jgi:hypothetical protein
MSATSTAHPDLAAVKRRRQQTWASGDYAAVATRIVLIAEQLVDAADLQAGTAVLDVATGSGNAALANWTPSGTARSTRPSRRWTNQASNASAMTWWRSPPSTTARRDRRWR